MCLTLLGLATAPGRASADPRDSTDSASKAVRQAEDILEDATALARTAAVRLAQANAALPYARYKVAVARGHVNGALAAATTAGRTADSARATYAQAVADAQQSQASVAVARGRVNDIALAAYKGSDIVQLTVLTNATGPRDMVERLSLVEQIMHTQRDEVHTLIGAQHAAQAAQDQAELAKRASEQAEAMAQTKLADAEAAQTAAQQAQQAVVGLAVARQAALQLANSQRDAMLARYRSAKAAELRIQASLRSLVKRSVAGFARGRSYGGGALLMPVNGYKSSDFGERYDPYYRVWQLHAGTDFAAGGGTPIHAAAAGRVIRTGFYGGYGNYTCLDHGVLDGQSFSTCYGHQSAILVQVGQYVERGYVIGRVGTTGASTGYHLHFETRFDGAPRNPLPYLPSCLC